MLVNKFMNIYGIIGIENAYATCGRLSHGVGDIIQEKQIPKTTFLFPNSNDCCTTIGLLISLLSLATD